MTVEYPLLQGRPWDLKSNVNEPVAEDAPLFARLSRDLHHQREQKREEPSSNAYLFVLFVKLPSWQNNDSRGSTPEIKTLRNLKNGIEVYQVKAALELSTGLPAHITYLVSLKNEKLTDNTRLVIGKNVKNGTSFRLEVIDAWADAVKAGWTGNVPLLLSSLPEHKSSEASLRFQEFSSAIEESGKENAFCALFAASARGRLSVCRAILEKGYDPNQATFFGNSSLHAAAFNGEFEVIQLLITCGSSVRSTNTQKKTALDIAATNGHIDCARWLWLNQWSIRASKTKRDNDESLKGNRKSPSSCSPRDNKQLYPAKPLQECSTLFTRPDKVTLPPMAYLAGSSSVAPTTLSNVRRSLDRPKSSPLAWKINKSESKVTFAANDASERIYSTIAATKAKTARPQTASAKKGRYDVSQQTAPPVPKLLPQLASSLSRERSIPSVMETRFQSHAVAHLRVDIKSSSVVKPVSVDLTLNNRWINPKSYNSFENVPNTAVSSSGALDRHSGTVQNDAGNSRFSAPEKRIMTQQSIQIPVASKSKSLPKKEETFNVEEKKEKATKDSDLDDRKKRESLVLAKALADVQKLKSRGKERSVSANQNRSSTQSRNGSKPDAKSFSDPIDFYDSLHGKGATTPDPSSERKLDNNSHLHSDLNINDKEKLVENSRSSSSSDVTKQLISSKSFPSVVKNTFYEQYKKKTTSIQEAKQNSQSLSREELLRRERNKNAWHDWLQTKHKEAASLKKKNEVAKKQSDHSAGKFGMTFDEWLADKKKDLPKKSPEESAPPPTTTTTTTRSSTTMRNSSTSSVPSASRRPRTALSGKTFDEWLKEKKEGSKEGKESQPQSTPEEIQKMEEKRQRAFATWSAKKLEEAKKEKERQEMEEQKKRNSLNQMHEIWLSKNRVLPFEAWKRKKEEEKKRKLKEEMEEAEKEYLNTWSAEQKKEKAEQEYKRWMIKKHSLLLKEAADELKEAKLRREETEKKLRIRQALLRAKVLLRWQRIAKNNKKWNGKRLSRDGSSMSLSTGDIASRSSADDDDVVSRDLTSHSDDESRKSRSKKKKIFKKTLMRIMESEQSEKERSSHLNATLLEAENDPGKLEFAPVEENKLSPSDSSSSSGSNSSSGSKSDEDTKESSRKTKRRKKKLKKHVINSASTTKDKPTDSSTKQEITSSTSLDKNNKLKVSQKQSSSSIRAKSAPPVKTRNSAIKSTSSSPYSSSISYASAKPKKKSKKNSTHPDQLQPGKEENSEEKRNKNFHQIMDVGSQEDLTKGEVLPPSENKTERDLDSSDAAENLPDRARNLQILTESTSKDVTESNSISLHLNSEVPSQRDQASDENKIQTSSNVLKRLESSSSNALSAEDESISKPPSASDEDHSSMREAIQSETMSSEQVANQLRADVSGSGENNEGKTSDDCDVTNAVSDTTTNEERAPQPQVVGDLRSQSVRDHSISDLHGTALLQENTSNSSNNVNSGGKSNPQDIAFLPQDKSEILDPSNDSVLKTERGKVSSRDQADSPVGSSKKTRSEIVEGERKKENISPLHAPSVIKRVPKASNNDEKVIKMNRSKSATERPTPKRRSLNGLNKRPLSSNSKPVNKMPTDVGERGVENTTANVPIAAPVFPIFNMKNDPEEFEDGYRPYSRVEEVVVADESKSVRKKITIGLPFSSEIMEENDEIRSSSPPEESRGFTELQSQ